MTPCKISSKYWGKDNQKNIFLGHGWITGKTRSAAKTTRAIDSYDETFETE